MRISALLVIFCVALAAGLVFSDFNSFSQTGETDLQAKLAPNTGAWYGLAMAAIMLCVFLNGLLYMLGVGFGLESLKKYARAEFLQVTASAFMIVFAVALLYELSGSGGVGGGAYKIMGQLLGTGGTTVACSAAPNGQFEIWGDSQFGTGPIGAFKCKVQSNIDSAESCYDKLRDGNMAEEALASVCMSVFGAPVWCFDWLSDVHKDVEAVHYLTTKLVGLLITLNAQYAAAEYIQNTMLPVFLPIGLILRILPFTRGVGGLFIAVAIGFYFVWPTFYVLTDPTGVRVMQSNQNTQNAERTAGACFTGFKGAATLLSTYTLSTTGVSVTQAAAYDCSRDTADIFVSTFFYPFISFAITLMFIRFATPLLGGDMGDIMKAVARLG